MQEWTFVYLPSLIIPTLFACFLGHAIPTSFYIFNVFQILSVLLQVTHTVSEGAMNQRFVWYHQAIPEKIITHLLPLTLLLVPYTRNNTDGNKLMIFSSTALYCADVIAVHLSSFVIDLIAVTLSGTGGEQFRGLLVQGRQVADGSPVGTFINFDSNTQASQCSPPTVLSYIPWVVLNTAKLCPYGLCMYPSIHNSGANV